ncbi:MAG TPA: hypothetical protein VFZ58_04905 [Candidatus Saccharimonadales bacterium]
MGATRAVTSKPSFSAFTEPVTGNDAEVLAGDLTLFSTAATKSAIGLGLVFVLGAIAFRNVYLLIGVLVVGLFWVTGGAVTRKRRSREQIGARLRKFSQDNRYSFKPLIKDLSLSYPGTLFTTEQNGAYTNFVVKGDIQGHAFWMGLYWFENKVGKQTIMYRQPVMALTLPRAVPHVILDRFNKQSTYRPGMELFELEGDFNKYFSVFCAPGYQQDILYFLTPELMQLLLDTDQQFDLEIIGDQLYVYGNRQMEGTTFDSAVWPAMFQAVSLVGLELIENTQRYQDHRVSAVAGTLGPQGIVAPRHLPKAITYIAYVIIAILVFVAVITSS